MTPIWELDTLHRKMIFREELRSAHVLRFVNTLEEFRIGTLWVKLVPKKSQRRWYCFCWPSDYGVAACICVTHRRGQVKRIPVAGGTGCGWMQGRMG